MITQMTEISRKVLVTLGISGPILLLPENPNWVLENSYCLLVNDIELDHNHEAEILKQHYIISELPKARGPKGGSNTI